MSDPFRRAKAATFIRLPHAVIEHQRRRPAREASTKYRSQSPASHFRTGGLCTTSSAADRAMTATTLRGASEWRVTLIAQPSMVATSQIDAVDRGARDRRSCGEGADEILKPGSQRDGMAERRPALLVPIALESPEPPRILPADGSRRLQKRDEPRPPDDDPPGQISRSPAIPRSARTAAAPPGPGISLEPFSTVTPLTG